MNERIQALRQKISETHPDIKITALARGLRDLTDDYMVHLEGDSSTCSIIVWDDKREAAVAHIDIRRTRRNPGTWEVKSSAADRGWGPFVYDLALEFVHYYDDDGLIADRHMVSKSAERVWSYYLKRRRDVKAEPLTSDFSMFDKYGEDSPLSYRYSKSHMKTLLKLESMGLIDGDYNF